MGVDSVGGSKSSNSKKKKKNKKTLGGTSLEFIEEENLNNSINLDVDIRNNEKEGLVKKEDFDRKSTNLEETEEGEGEVEEEGEGEDVDNKDVIDDSVGVGDKKSNKNKKKKSKQKAKSRQSSLTNVDSPESDLTVKAYDKYSNNNQTSNSHISNPSVLERTSSKPRQTLSERLSFKNLPRVETSAEELMIRSKGCVCKGIFRMLTVATELGLVR